MPRYFTYGVSIAAEYKSGEASEVFAPVRIFRTHLYVFLVRGQGSEVSGQLKESDVQSSRDHRVQPEESQFRPTTTARHAFVLG